jgi:hypothetical protein
LAATFGGVVLFWQYGWGSKAVFNVAPTGSITFWLPIMIFTFLFGLSIWTTRCSSCRASARNMTALSSSLVESIYLDEMNVPDVTSRFDWRDNV